MPDIRPEVRIFAMDMEERLRANDCKGKTGWRSMSYNAIMKRLREEVDELRDAITSHTEEWNLQEVVREAADVANFAMFAADVATFRSDENKKANEKANKKNRKKRS